MAHIPLADMVEYLLCGTYDEARLQDTAEELRVSLEQTKTSENANSVITNCFDWYEKKTVMQGVAMDSNCGT